ncbi:MAG TPA: ferritin-like domain-containing protein [Acidimicrobiales bacterium]|nr:ferritin-like domain-containing protein [Acidimicrobiales bacterium]
MQEFLADVKALRERAREVMNQGLLTDSHGADQDRVVHVLNQALATEIVCVLRYKRHYFTADALNAQSAADEFLEHASEEQDHADQIAERIRQLGGEPDFNPDTVSARGRSFDDSFEELEAMMREDLVAERVAIAAYGEIVDWLGSADLATRRMLESILAVEEEHAEDMLDLLTGIS